MQIVHISKMRNYDKNHSEDNVFMLEMLQR